MAEFSTPLMRQYSSIKQRHPQALLFFRLGDFYEMFFDDAVIAARELQITLTSRNKEKGEPIPMCGVPYHAAEGYIARLVRKGFRVAVCDQMEDPRLAKKLVKREVTRVVSPGTSIHPESLEPRANNYLAAAVEREGAIGVAFADLSTGDFRATEFSGVEAVSRFQEEIDRMRPSELLLPASGDSSEAAPARGDSRALCGAPLAPALK
ncbi:MAG: DNA mismatch repair protein MutS, partial [Terriglobia bacterium]